MNAVEWNRDLSRSLADVRRDEAHLTDKRDRGRGTVTLPELRRAEISMCVATLIARVEMNGWSPVAGWRSQAQAWAITEAQLAWYRAMEEAGTMRCIRTRADLDVESGQAGSSRWRTVVGAPADPPANALAPAVPFVFAAVVLILSGVALGYAG